MGIQHYTLKSNYSFEFTPSGAGRAKGTCRSIQLLCASKELSLNLNDRERVESLYQERAREDHSQYKKLQ